jgi:hypothetical protein
VNCLNTSAGNMSSWQRNGIQSLFLQWCRESEYSFIL